MRVLLDTNVFLWCIAGKKYRLSARAGKLELPEEKDFFQEHMALLGIDGVLAIEASHVFGVFQLPDHHRDPFDRLLAAQCMVEKLPLVASDAVLRRYPIEVIW